MAIYHTLATSNGEFDWPGVLDLSTPPASVSATEIILTNGDDTQTVISGTGLDTDAGVITSLTRFTPEPGISVLAEVTGLSLPVSDLVSEGSLESLLEWVAVIDDSFLSSTPHADNLTAALLLSPTQLLFTNSDGSVTTLNIDQTAVDPYVTDVQHHDSNSIGATLLDEVILSPGDIEVPTDLTGPAALAAALLDVLSDALFSGADTIINDSNGTILMPGNTGDDEFFDNGNGNNILDGDDGIDTANYSAATGNLIIDLDAGTATSNPAAGAGGIGSDTLSSIENATGGIGNDNLTGDDEDNVLIGGAGNDVLDGGQGDDEMQGGEGTDTASFASLASLINGVTVGMSGGTATGVESGTDTLFSIENVTGSLGNDRVYGSADDNLIAGNAGHDRLFGNDGDDTVHGQSGNDVMFGGAGEDTMNGGSGADYLDGGDGVDTMNGGSGKDRLFGQDGDDIMDGGAADDILFGGAGEDTMNGGIGADFLAGDDGDDIMDGGAADDILFGGAGNDIMDGGAGEDTMYGQDGNDVMDGGYRADMMWGDAGDDTMNGGTGSDRMLGGDGVDTMHGDDDNDTLFGQDGNDMIWGDAGDDKLFGQNGDDTLDGGAGDDKILGGTGVDTMTGGDGNDTFYFAAGSDENIITDFTISVPADNDTINLGFIDALEGLDLRKEATYVQFLIDHVDANGDGDVVIFEDKADAAAATMVLEGVGLDDIQFNLTGGNIFDTAEDGALF